jgi:polysaccharide deacetylase family protein (PEP-CTERM system associated)
MKNVLTFDVEEHFQVEAFYDVIPREEWAVRQSRLMMNMLKILDLLDEFGVKATFFILGWVAERYPYLVAMVKSRGHEIASHGYGHNSLKRMDKDDFREDLARSLEAIRSATSVDVAGYRAPTFSAERSREWIWETLVELGFEYDSSIYPIKHDLYGDPGAPQYPYEIKTSNGALLEIPPTTCTMLGKRLPACGGGSFRLFPYWYTKRAICAYNSNGYPAMVYLHPWEIDPAQPRVENAGFKSRLRHYTNLSGVECKLRRLLHDFEFGSVRDIYMTSQTKAS